MSSGFPRRVIGLAPVLARLVALFLASPGCGKSSPVRPDAAAGTQADGMVRLAEGRFVDVASASGLGDYRAGTGEPSGEKHGPGGVFTDLDGDGYPDIFLVTAAGEPFWLLRNVAGQRFERLPFDPDARPGSTGAVAADYDNDGDVDLYVTNYAAPNQLYRNLLIETGQLAFEDVTAATVPPATVLPGAGGRQAGLGVAYHGDEALLHSMTAAWADVDRDGWPDLYVGNHDGSVQGAGSRALPGERDVLYRNRGDGTFVDVTLAAGVPGWSLPDGAFADAHQSFASTNAVLFADLDGDGWPDLVVTNKTGTPADRDMVYRNRGLAGDGTWLGFENQSYALTVGTTTPLAMGIDAGDVDNDGDLDLYVTDYAPRDSVIGPNELWLNQSGAGAGGAPGRLDFVRSLAAPGAFSWGTKFLDYDADGRIDLHVTAGERLVGLLYRNTGAGFVELGYELGIARAIDGRGDMTADFDRDGALDLLVLALNAKSSLFHNRVVAVPNTLSLRLIGAPHAPGRLRSTRDALGARVFVTAELDGDGRRHTQLREVRSGDSNAASTSSLRLHFGLGRADSAELRIAWPSGRQTVEVLTGLGAPRTLTRMEPSE